MTDSDDSIERGKAERRELEAAGWEPKGRGAKTIWKSPADGRWYAHHQAVEMKRKGERAEEEGRFLDEHGFERAPTEGQRERWERREGEQQRRYTRSEAVKRARKDHDLPATYVQMEGAMIIHKKASDEGSAT